MFILRQACAERCSSFDRPVLSDVHPSTGSGRTESKHSGPPDYDRAIVEEIDDIVYRINLEHDVFISVLIFGKDELEEGPMSESPIYKVIQMEGVPL